MPSIRSLGLLAGLPALTTAAATAKTGSGIIRHGVTAKMPPTTGADWFKRQDDDAVTLKQRRTGTLYTIDIEIGTPGQPVTVLVDTGSDELWINPDCSTAGSDTNEAFCKSLPRFDAAKSSSVNHTGETGKITYGRGHVDLDYLADQVRIGDATLDGQIFGTATSSSDVPIGLIGLAPPLDGGKAPYPLLLDNFAQQGHIESRAFSLDLRSIDSPEGSVIFGGIDTGKFSGSLAKLPIVDRTEQDGDRYWVNLDSAGITLPGGDVKSFHKASDAPIAVFLDSGGTLSRLPTAIYTGVGNAFPTAQFDSESQYYVVDCSVADGDGSVDFGFGDKTIRVDFKDFIWHVPDTDYCVVGLLPDDEQPVLGDSFLRAAYVVYDQDNRNLHLAQADNCGEHLVAISSGPDAVPSVTGDCGASTPTPTPSSAGPTGTGGAPISSVPTGSVPYPTANSTASYPAGSSPAGGYPTGGSSTSASAPVGSSPAGGYPTGGSSSDNSPTGSSPAGSSPAGYPTGGSTPTSGSSPVGGSSPAGGYPTGGSPATTASAQPTGSSPYPSASTATSDDCTVTSTIIVTPTPTPTSSTCTEEESTSTKTYPKPTYTTSYKVTKTVTVPAGYTTTQVVTTTTTWCPEVPVVSIPVLVTVPLGGPGGKVRPSTSSAYPTSTPSASAAPSTTAAPPPASYPAVAPSTPAATPAPYPTTTLATSPAVVPSSVGTVGTTAVQPSSYPTGSPIPTAGAGKVGAASSLAAVVFGVVAWML